MNDFLLNLKQLSEALLFCFPIVAFLSSKDENSDFFHKYLGIMVAMLIIYNLFAIC